MSGIVFLRDVTAHGVESFPIIHEAQAKIVTVVSLFFYCRFQVEYLVSRPFVRPVTTLSFWNIFV